MSIIDFFKEAFRPPDPSFRIGHEEQEARSARNQAKLEKERREFLENVWPQMQEEIHKDSLRAMKKLKDLDL